MKAVSVPRRPAAVLRLVAVAVVAVHPSPPEAAGPPAAPDRPAAASPAAAPPPGRAGDDADRKAEVLAGGRWRRAIHEFDGWLATQPAYQPAEARRIRAELDRRVAAMSSYEVEYLLDGLEEKLSILDSPGAAEAREWLGRYLSVMADRRRAALLSDVPDVLDMSAAELSEKLAEVEAKRRAVEREARDSRRGRREFAAFLDESRAAVEADRARLGRIRRGDVAFSPYRGRPIDPPPGADSVSSRTAVGVGPWGSFVDMCFPAF